MCQSTQRYMQTHVSARHVKHPLCALSSTFDYSADLDSLCPLFSDILWSYCGQQICSCLNECAAASLDDAWVCATLLSKCIVLAAGMAATIDAALWWPPCKQLLVHAKVCLVAEVMIVNIGYLWRTCMMSFWWNMQYHCLFCWQCHVAVQNLQSQVLTGAQPNFKVPNLD